MKRTLSLLLAAAIAGTIFFCTTTDRHATTPQEGAVATGELLYGRDEEGQLVVGEFYRDGTLSLAWVHQKRGRTLVSHALAPATELDTLRTGESDTLDLSTLPAQVSALGLPVSSRPAGEHIGKWAVFDQDPLLENALRLHLAGVCDTEEYSSKVIAAGSSGPLRVQILEDKTVTFAQTSLTSLKAGWDLAQVTAALVATTGSPETAVAHYATATMDFTDGFLTTDLSVIGCTGALRYIRTASLQASQDTAQARSPSIREEKLQRYTFLFLTDRSDTNTTDLMAVTDLVSGPVESWSDTEEAFSELSLLRRAYAAYDRQ